MDTKPENYEHTPINAEQEHLFFDDEVIAKDFTQAVNESISGKFSTLPDKCKSLAIKYIALAWSVDGSLRDEEYWRTKSDEELGKLMFEWYAVEVENAT